jgi:hypothetical protein
MPATDLHIVKTELFDADVMDILLKSDGFSKKQRDVLSRYHKGRKHANQVEVVYHYAKGFEETSLGRLYPRNNQGLQAFPFDMRNPLLEKYYWDVDMENCHYVILAKMADDWGLPTEAIHQYIDNRDVELQRVSSERHISKTAFLKIAYGGNIRLHNEFHDDDGVAEGDLSLIRRIEKEMSCIVERVWVEHKSYHKFVKNKSNPKFSLFALILQTEERKCLLAMNDYFQTAGRSVDVLIHDGLDVRKIEGETSFDANLLRGAEKVILDTCGYKHRLCVKPFKHNFVMPKTESIEDKAKRIYEEWKIAFEKNHFEYKPANVTMEIPENGEIVTYDKSHALQVFNIYQLPINKKSGKPWTCIEKWLEDPSRRQATHLVYKYEEDCMPHEATLWRGYAYSKTRPCDPEIEKTVVDTFLDMLRCVTNDEEKSFEYVLKWMAHIIQRPFKKTGAAVCFINQEKGTGKDSMASWFREVIGDAHTAQYTSEAQLWEKHDSKKEGAILMYLEEVGGGLNFEHNEDVKTLITSGSITINKKNVKAYEVPNIGNILATSQKPQPFKIEDGCRRFWFVQGSLRLWKKNDYWTHFYKITNLNHTSEPMNPDWIGPVGRYLEQIDLEGFDPDPRLWVNSHMELVLNAKRDPVRCFLEQWEGENVTGSDLYRSYVNYCMEGSLHPGVTSWIGLSLKMSGFPHLYHRKRVTAGYLYSCVSNVGMLGLGSIPGQV